MKPWEAMTADERDLWVACNLFGWRKVSNGCVDGYGPPGCDDPIAYPKFSTNPADDYRVLDGIRELPDVVVMINFERHFAGLLHDAQEADAANNDWIVYYQPGMWSHAAYLALQEPQP